MRDDKLQLFRPTLGDAELAAVKEVFDSGWIGYGPRCEGVEKSWAFTVGAKFGIATNSCTSALQVALRLRGIGPGKKVLVPTMTFAATAEAVIACGAEVLFCDVDPQTLLIDLDGYPYSRLRDIDLIIVVLYAGQPLDLGDNYKGVPIIYDCAHAAGASFHAGGKMCCWSFQAVKNLGCGDGGMVTLDDESLQTKGKAIAWHGISRSTWHRSMGKHYTWDYNIENVGIKGQMNDITAAILSVQIGRLGEQQSIRRQIRYLYGRKLSEIEFIGESERLDQSSHHLVVIRHERRNELADFLAKRQIVTGVHYRPLHMHSAYLCREVFPVAQAAFDEILTLPCHPTMSRTDVRDVCQAIKDFNNET